MDWINDTIAIASHADTKKVDFKKERIESVIGLDGKQRTDLSVEKNRNIQFY